jgi:hypothetical protein
MLYFKDKNINFLNNFKKCVSWLARLLITLMPEADQFPMAVPTLPELPC